MKNLNLTRINQIITFLKSLNIESKRFIEIIDSKDQFIMSYFNEALTHSSGNKFINYEKLEFFGDAVLRLAASNFIEKKYTHLSVGERSELRSQIVSDEWLTRLGKKVDGFDFGNSPTKINSKEFKEKKVALATSNGTKAILKTKSSKISLIGSFLNLDIIIDYINKENSDVLLLCSGWKGSVNLEDTLCAGGIISGLKNFQFNSDTVLMAKKLYESSKDNNVINVIYNEVIWKIYSNKFKKWFTNQNVTTMTDM